MSKLIRSFVVACLTVATLAVTGDPSSAVCSWSPEFVGIATGTVDPAQTTDGYRHRVAPGSYRITVTSDTGNAGFYVLNDATCEIICGSYWAEPVSCVADIDYTGWIPVYVYLVSGGTTSYQLTVVPESIATPTQCNDTLDNDLDGRSDLDDSDCANSSDTSEGAYAPGCSTVAGVTACASYSPTGTFDEYVAYLPDSSPTRVTAYIDLYRFTLPNGGQVTLPCAIVPGSGTEEACSLAGGEYTGRMTDLVDQYVGVPSGPLTKPAATVRLCHADLVVTVNNVGINTFPSYTVC
jgi:hypothetical protein